MNHGDSFESFAFRVQCSRAAPRTRRAPQSTNTLSFAAIILYRFSIRIDLTQAETFWLHRGFLDLDISVVFVNGVRLAAVIGSVEVRIALMNQSIVTADPNLGCA